MQAMDDMALLREYAANNSETAFAELVSRRMNLVYSSALRQVRDPHLAGKSRRRCSSCSRERPGAIRPQNHFPGWFFRAAGLPR